MCRCSREFPRRPKELQRGIQGCSFVFTEPIRERDSICYKRRTMVCVYTESVWGYVFWLWLCDMCVLNNNKRERNLIWKGTIKKWPPTICDRQHTVLSAGIHLPPRVYGTQKDWERGKITRKAITNETDFLIELLNYKVAAFERHACRQLVLSPSPWPPQNFLTESVWSLSQQSIFPRQGH